ncbi:MAG: ATP-binding protein [Pyrodictiaceae archaeon]
MPHKLRQCSYCNRPAIIYLPYARLRLCREHFIEFVKNRVRKTIEKYHMIRKGEKIVVGVSGGKDSITLLHVLHELSNELGFTLLGVHIDLGIRGYSDKLRKTSIENFERLGVDYVIIEVKKILKGDGIKDFASKARRPICSVCGMVKRYLLNLIAIESGAAAVATGHTLDDILAYILKSELLGGSNYSMKLLPRTDSVEGIAAARIRPLMFISERETKAFVKAKGATYVEEHCPYKPQGGFEELTKEYLNKLEEAYPSIKLSLIRRFIKRYSSNREEGSTSMSKCKYCGMPAEAEVCGFCKLTRRVYGEPLGPSARDYVASLL